MTASTQIHKLELLFGLALLTVMAEVNACSESDVSPAAAGGEASAGGPDTSAGGADRSGGGADAGTAAGGRSSRAEAGTDASGGEAGQRPGNPAQAGEGGGNQGQAGEAGAGGAGTCAQLPLAAHAYGLYSVDVTNVVTSCPNSDTPRCNDGSRQQTLGKLQVAVRLDPNPDFAGCTDVVIQSFDPAKLDVADDEQPPPLVYECLVETPESSDVIQLWDNLIYPAPYPQGGAEFDGSISISISRSTGRVLDFKLVYPFWGLSSTVIKTTTGTGHLLCEP